MFKNFIAGLFGLIIAAILLEIIFRICNPFPFRVKGNRIFLQCNRRIVVDCRNLRGAGGKVVHTKNALGFRGEEKPASLDGYLSIIAVGGSTTECYYLADEAAWPARLGRRLDGRYRQVWINNAGIDGHSTFGHRILLEEFLLPLKPKMILFLVGVNDRGRDDLKADQSNLYETLPLARRLMKKSEIATTVVNLQRVFLARKSGVTHGSLDLARAPRAVIADPVISEAVERHKRMYIAGYRKRLTGLVERCKSNGIEPVLITQPSLLGEGKDDVTGVDLETVGVAQYRNGKCSWKVLQAYNEVTVEIARQEQVPAIDLGALMPKTSRYFYDEFHFTAAGADKTAEIIYDGLRPYLDEKYRPLVRK